MLPFLRPSILKTGKNPGAIPWITTWTVALKPDTANTDYRKEGWKICTRDPMF